MTTFFIIIAILCTIMGLVNIPVLVGAVLGNDGGVATICLCNIAVFILVVLGIILLFAVGL
jgi:hypothetical protein